VCVCVCVCGTEPAVQSHKQLADAEGDGGVSRDDDGLVSAFGVPAVVDLKLQEQVGEQKKICILGRSKLLMK